MTDLWDDPDRAVQIEDSDPESLAGDEVEFNPEQEDFPSDPLSSAAIAGDSPAEGGA